MQLKSAGLKVMFHMEREFHPVTAHEGTEGNTGIALLFIVVNTTYQPLYPRK
jgi:hypothetical protein